MLDTIEIGCTGLELVLNTQPGPGHNVEVLDIKSFAVDIVGEFESRHGSHKHTRPYRSSAEESDIDSSWRNNRQVSKARCAVAGRFVILLLASSPTAHLM
jgi:hypothetical protein